MLVKDGIKGRVFILGAGFSAGAGIPLTTDLLGKAMHKFSQECPGIYQRVNNYAQQCFDCPDREVDYSQNGRFQELCTFLEFVELREYGGGERWSDAGSREKLALRFYLAKTITEHTPSQENIPDLYSEFANQLRPLDVVISFNWDCLLEVALLKLGKRYAYTFHDEGAIKLAKLHGSINWRVGEPHDFGRPANTLEWQPMGISKKDGYMQERDIYFTERLLNYRDWNHYEPLREVDPFLVLPGYGKAFDVRLNSWIWYKPEYYFGHPCNVFIVGLGLSHDDFFIRSYFLSTLPFLKKHEILIINPDSNSEQNYSFVLKRCNAKLLIEPFSLEHVELMKGFE